MDKQQNQSLLKHSVANGEGSNHVDGIEDLEKDLKTRVWIESKKLWHVTGPTIFSLIANFSMIIVTQAFAGHLGNVELASISIANNVIVGFNFGLLVT